MSHWDLLNAGTTSVRDRNEDEWSGLVPVLERQGLAGYVYGRWGSRLPGGISEKLREAWANSWRQNTLYREELVWIGSQCARENLKPVVLKGAVLLEEVFEDPGRRAMSDIDILVENDGHWERLTLILKNRGYDEVRAKKWRGNAFKLLLSRFEGGNELVIELHRRLFMNEGARPPWKTRPFSIDGLFKLAPEDMLVHCAGHLAYQHTFSHLNWLLDIDLMLRRETRLDWNRVVELATKLGKKQSLAMVLSLLVKFFETPVPARVMGTFASFRTLAGLRVISEDFLWAPHEHKIRYYIAKHLVKDTLTEALKYDLMWIKGAAWKK